MTRRLLGLSLLALFLLPLLAQSVYAQQVGGVEFTIEKSELKLRVYPDGSVQPVYELKASIALPPGSLKETSVDIMLSYKAAYEERASSTELSVNGKISSTGLNASTGKLFIELGAKASQEGTNIVAALSGAIVFSNKTSEINIKIIDMSIRARNTSKAVFHVEIEAKGLRPGESRGKMPTVDEINKELAAKGLDFIEVKSLGAMMEEGNKTKIVATGVIDIDRMLEDAIAAGMPASDAAKLKTLLATQMSIQTKAKLVLKAESAQNRIVFALGYDSETKGDLDKAEKVSKEAAPLVNELVTALIRRVAQATGNQELLQMLLVGSMTGAKQPRLPVAIVPPTQSEAEAHIYSTVDKVVIEVSYEGPRQRITPSSGNPSTDAEKMLTLLSAQLVELKSQLARLGLLLPGAENLVPSKVEIEPATSNVRVSKTTASISELPALKVEIKQATTPTQTKVKTTTTTEHKTTTKTKPGATTSTASATTTSTETTTTQPTKTPTSTTTIATGTGTEQGRKQPSGIVIGAVIAAIVVILAAILIARRR